MDPLAFVAKWKKTTLSERSAAQQHFLDLCDLVGHAKPADADPAGEWFTFERGAAKTAGKRGWADVWKRGFFAVEYKGKGKHKDLAAAYSQLLQYRESLDNPPLLIVSDIGRTEIHTNFTGTAKQVHAFTLEQVANPDSLATLRKAFHDPDALKPGQTTRGVTEDVAERFAGLGESLWSRGVPVEAGAQFLMRLMFCMFAEKVELLHDRLFSKVLNNFARSPRRLANRLGSLFARMAKGGVYGPERIPHFNGGLFADPASFELTRDEAESLVAINECEWGNVEPSIFGTLLERTIDPNKRHQIGMHYTSREDIVAVLEPVMMAPLRNEWEEVKGRCEALWRIIEANVASAEPSGRRRKPSPQRREFDKILLDFVQRLAEVTILDPACGSGNFLYVALNLLLELEKEAITYASDHSTSVLPHVTPSQLAGLETNGCALELARVVVWIGYLQWKFQNGFAPRLKPVLDPVDRIQHMDAILDRSNPSAPTEPDWPECEFIVGNPPFLGGSKARKLLGDECVEGLFKVYKGRVPSSADLCCYWFEKARAMIAAHKCKRAGFLATQAIRGGANRTVLKDILRTGGIFFAESDREWILDGASVRVSMVGFDQGGEKCRILDGAKVAIIHSNLTAGVDVTRAVQLKENQGLWCYGSQQKAQFDISARDALAILSAPNPHGRPNSDVVRASVNGKQILQRTHETFVVDFEEESSEQRASLYEAPFELIRRHVFPVRRYHREDRQRKLWWLHARPSPRYRAALKQGAVHRHSYSFQAPSVRLRGHVLSCRSCHDRLPDVGRILFRRPSFERSRGLGQIAGHTSP